MAAGSLCRSTQPLLPMGTAALRPWQLSDAEAVVVAPEARPVPIEAPVGTKVRRIAVSGVDNTRL